LPAFVQTGAEEIVFDHVRTRQAWRQAVAGGLSGLLSYTCVRNNTLRSDLRNGSSSLGKFVLERETEGRLRPEMRTDKS